MADRVGQQLGNYRLLRLLGRGGFAEVYLGEHVYLKSQAALKVLRTQFTGEDAHQFVREAQLLASLSHPHIVRILDYAVQDGLPFLVMDYAPGGTLRTRHPKQTRLPLETIVAYVSQVGEALQYAHDRRLIHRDVKPENMLLGSRSDVLLSDFGLAMLALHTPSASTQAIAPLAGTATYLAPEQLQGKAGPASDQYALGVVVYEWITGTPPFGGSLIEVAMQHLSVPPPSLREQVQDLSPAIEEVVLRALAIAPNLRFASVEVFASALALACQEAVSPQSTPGSTKGTGGDQLSPAPQPLHIHLLGEFQLVSAGTAITTVDWPRLQSLLAYLVLHSTAPQSRTHLAFLLWPDSTEAQAHTNLRHLVHRLRHALPDADTFLHVEKQTLQWRPEAPWILDVADFERALTQAEHDEKQTATGLALEQAVDLYRGDLLPGCYDEWVLSERERLRHLFLDALEQLTLLLEQERDYPTAIRTAQRLLRHDHLHEATYRHLMRLYAASGDRAAALRTYHTCGTVLERELAVEPDSATRAVYQRLVQKDAPEIPPVVPPPISVAAVPLLGRQHEWEQLQQAWQKVLAAEPHLVVLSGEAGIGKTRLAEELLTWVARQGIAAARSRCYAAEGALAYAPVASWLRAEAITSSLSTLADIWLVEVARFVPEILVKRPDLPRPGPLSEDWQRQHLLEALARALLGSRQPLLLLLDDLQWCDRETLAWLHYLLRFDPHARVLLVGTLRLEEMAVDHPLQSLLVALRRNRHVTEIELGPLNADETASLAAHVAGHGLDPEQVAELYQETEGNPLFVVETVRMSTAEGSERITSQGAKLPGTVQAVIAARLEQLTPKARELVNLAAVIGRAFTFQVLAQVSGGDEDALVRGLDELWQRRVVREQEADAYDFSHDKLREGAYAALSAARRRLLHRRVAEALEVVHASHLDAVSGQIATHYEQAHLPMQAMPYYRRAAEVAQQVYANEMAIDYYHRLLPLVEEREKCRVMLALGSVLQLTGRWKEAEAVYQQALSAAGAVSDLHTQAETQQALGDVVHLRGSYDAALGWLEQARSGFEWLGDQQGLSKTLWKMGEVYMYQGNFAQALAVLEQQMQVATAIGDRRGMCDAALTMGIVYWIQGDHPQALARCEQSLQLAQEIDHQFAASRAAQAIGHVYRHGGNNSNAFLWYTQALQFASTIGDRQGVGATIGSMGNVYASQGDYPRALLCFQYDLDFASENGDRWGTSLSLMSMGYIYASQGRFGEAERLYTRGMVLLRAVNSLPYLCEGLHMTADLYARQQRYAEAERLNAEAMQLAQQLENYRLGEEKTQFSVWVLAIRLRVALHRIDVPTAISELERLLQEWTEDRQQAAVQYELWRLDTTQQFYRQNAAHLYQTLYARTPYIEYRQRYEELTGESLPDPPQLPELPEMLRRRLVDLEVLLAQIDQAIGDLHSAGA